jgi:ubiquinone/menaquinone biosynthesis C-methylase UbiE
MADVAEHGARDVEFGDEYFDRLAAARDHWWVDGMRIVGAALLDERRTDLRVLDAGCGSGALLASLRDVAGRHDVVGVDFAWPGLALARRHTTGAVLGQASVTSLPFRAATFDLVVSTDVLQHLSTADERLAVAELARVLRPGGRLLVRTNAAFGRSHVEERDDWRLYRPATLEAALRTAGLDVETVTHANALQGLWASVPRRPRRGGGHAPHGHGHGHGHDGHDGGAPRPEWGTGGLGIPRPASTLRNRVLRMVLRAEAAWLRAGRHRLPFGHTLFAVARRR